MICLLYFHDGCRWHGVALMLHTSYGVLIGLVVNVHDARVEVFEGFDKLVLFLIHLAIDTPMAIGTAKVAVLALRRVVAKAEASVLTRVDQHVLVFRRQRTDEMEGGLCKFFECHQSVLLVVNQFLHPLFQSEVFVFPVAGAFVGLEGHGNET